MSSEGSLAQPSLSNFNLNSQCAHATRSIKNCFSLYHGWSGSFSITPYYRQLHTRVETCGWWCVPKVVVII